MNIPFPDHVGHHQAHQLDGYLAGIAQGDRDALEKLYHETSTPIYAYSLSILKNPQDAEDVLQDCFLRIYSAAADYRSHGKPMAWIMTIARNLCMMRLREQQKNAPLTEEDWNTALSQCEEMNIDDRIVISQYMLRLTEEERQIVVLHAVAGMKHREIAAMLSIPLPTVLSKYNRSIKKLKSYWERSA